MALTDLQLRKMHPQDKVIRFVDERGDVYRNPSNASSTTWLDAVCRAT